MQCVIKQFVKVLLFGFEKTRKMPSMEQADSCFVSSSASRWLSKLVLLGFAAWETALGWTMSSDCFRLISAAVFAPLFSCSIETRIPTLQLLCALTEFFTFSFNNLRTETFQNIFLVQLRPLYAPVHVRSNYELCQKFSVRRIAKLCSASYASDAFSM